MPAPATPPPPPPTALIATAHHLHAAGCTVIPSHPAGGKRPHGAWKHHQHGPMPLAQLDTLLATATGIGVVCGQASGNLELLEVEGRAVADGTYDQYRRLLVDGGHGALWHKVTAGYSERTPTGGIHVLYRVADMPVPGNTRLAGRPNPDGGVDVLIETRGEGGYVILAPSNGRTHPTGGSWTMLLGGPDSIATITALERQALHDTARQLNTAPIPAAPLLAGTAATHSPPPGIPDPFLTPRDTRAAGGHQSPYDDYATRTPWEDILPGDGWTLLRRHPGGKLDWRRPGKTDGELSATTGHGDRGHDLLYVFSTSTHLPAGESISKGRYHALTHHHGDDRAAAADLARRGYGTPPRKDPTPWLTPAPAPFASRTGATSQPHSAYTGASPAATTSTPPTLPGNSPTASDTSSSSGTPDDERTSWSPRDLGPYITGTLEPLQPAHLARADGHRLLYPGKINGLIGESESGKAQPYSALVQTPTGPRRMGDLRVGDHILGTGGTVQTVNAIHEQGDLEVWEVVTSDDVTVECCGEHLWGVQDVNDRHRAGRYRALPTAWLADKVRWPRGAPRWALPPAGTAQLDTGETLPIDPYLLGLLLGDGGLTKGVTFSSGDPELLQAAIDLAPAGVQLRPGGGYNYGLTTRRGQPNPLLNALRDLNLLGTRSETKHIPDSYLRSSPANRLALLQGLLDTDGGIDRRIVSYTSVSAELADNVRELVHSLGGTASTEWRTTHHSNGKPGQPSCRVSIRLPLHLEPFRLGRKAADYAAHATRREPNRTIRDIRRTGRLEPMRCLSVSNPDHLYLTNGYVPTHNTWVALLAVLQALQVAQPVLYIDAEDSPAGIVGRLRAIGATDTNLGHFDYMQPDEAFHTAAREDLARTLHDTEYSLIVLDGYNATMTLLGLELESNSDVTRFTQTLLKPLASTGAAVLYIDHVPKNKDARGKGGIGAQSKRAMTDGCTLLAETTTPFGKGISGRIALTVDKDRHGTVRGNAGRGVDAGHVDIEAHGDTLTLRIDPPWRPGQPSGPGKPFRPTRLMERVSRWLEDTPGLASTVTITDNVHGKETALKTALDVLVAEGHVRRELGPRGALLHASISPYREAADPDSDTPPDDDEPPPEDGL